MPGIHLNFLLILVLAVAATTVAGTLIGVPTLRLRGDYIAMVTLAFGEIVGKIVSNGRSIELFGGTLTSGPIGIGPIDRIDLPLLGRFGAWTSARGTGSRSRWSDWCWWRTSTCAARASAGRGSRCATTSRPPPRPGSRSSAPSSWPTERAPRSAASRARSSPPTWASSTRSSSSSRSRSSSSRWSCWAASDRSRASWPARSSSRWSTATCCPTSWPAFRARLGLAFDLSVISSGIYGAIILVVMLLRPRGLVPARRLAPRFRKSPRVSMLGDAYVLRARAVPHAAPAAPHCDAACSCSRPRCSRPCSSARWSAVSCCWSRHSGPRRWPRRWWTSRRSA